MTRRTSEKNLTMSVFSPQTQFHLCHYAVCHDETEFADAELFVPERWLRGEALRSGYYQHHPYSFIPFGVGVRACVGKRVAEMEMYFALSRVRLGRSCTTFSAGRTHSSLMSVCPPPQLMQHYEVRLEDEGAVVEPKTRTLLIPAKPINLRFLPRG